MWINKLTVKVNVQVPKFVCVDQLIWLSLVLLLLSGSFSQGDARKLSWLHCLSGQCCWESEVEMGCSFVIKCPGLGVVPSWWYLLPACPCPAVPPSPHVSAPKPALRGALELCIAPVRLSSSEPLLAQCYSLAFSSLLDHCICV